MFEIKYELFGETRSNAGHSYGVFDSEKEALAFLEKDEYPYLS